MAQSCLFSFTLPCFCSLRLVTRSVESSSLFFLFVPCCPSVFLLTGPCCCRERSPPALATCLPLDSAVQWSAAQRKRVGSAQARRVEVEAQETSQTYESPEARPLALCIRLRIEMARKAHWAGVSLRAVQAAT
jgi:hypothetical protein